MMLEVRRTDAPQWSRTERLSILQPPGCRETHCAPILSAAGPVLPAECLLDRGPGTGRGFSGFTTTHPIEDQSSSSSRETCSPGSAV